MTFIHGYLLGGLLLAGVPVLLHLLMRQKPRRVRFPAFRFLKARQRVNQRKVRLQHLLLLLLRVAVIVALCLALARPRIFASRTGDAGDRAVVAALVVDTSASMDYAVSGKTRLDDARQKAGELLDEMNDASRVAFIDSGEEAGTSLLPKGEVRSRLDHLAVRPAAGSLNLAVERGLRLLEGAEADEGTPRLLYVFTDRTRAAWDSGGAAPKVPAGVSVIVVDVGVDSPRDLDVEGIEVFPPVVAPGGTYKVRVTVRGTPTGHETQLSCVLDSAAPADRTPERRPLVMPKGVTRTVVAFEMTAPQPPAGGSTTNGDVAHQLTVQVATRDALGLNNARYATFFVRNSRRLLTLVDARSDRTRLWQTIHASTRSFRCDVRTFAEADKLTADELAGYSVVALFEVAAVPEGWWKKLADHASAGGGIAIIPGGEEVADGLAAFNRGGLAAGVLPAPLEKLASTPEGEVLPWARFSGSHPLMKPFVDWSRSVDPDFDRDELRPFVRRYWQLGAVPRDAIVISNYADPRRTPALVERDLGKGKCVLFTSPLDFRWVDEARTLQWNNYWPPSSFGMILVDRVCLYLGGEVNIPQRNFVCGQVTQLDGLGRIMPPLTLSGPGLAGAERSPRLPAPGKPLQLPQAVQPGNYALQDGQDRPLTGFSVNLPAGETVLDRIPVEELEAVFGKDSVIQAGQTTSLSDALAASRPAPLELLPALMIALLAILTLESLLANRFYRRASGEDAPPSIRQITQTLSPGAKV